MTRQALHAALRAAIAARDIAALRQLFSEYGVLAFAGAVSACSPRVAADALSLLISTERTAVLRHLPPTVRDSLRPLGLELGDHPGVACRSAPRPRTPYRLQMHAA